MISSASSGRHALVGVKRQDPVVRRQRRRRSSSARHNRASPSLEPDALRTARSPRSVGAARVHDDDFVGPPDTVDGRADVLGFVQRDDGDRQRWHTRILREDARILEILLIYRPMTVVVIAPVG